MGDPENEITISSVTKLQFPLFVELKVNVADPAANSVALGVYVPVSAVLFGLNDPLAPLQIPVVVMPETNPDNETAALFLQAIKFNPAFTVGAFEKLMINVSFT